ncbi:hypothetical protein N7540_001075 [Penicillium herquei]|nr:hypothetical protein N7540_001075 [Penicillium herquei]
MGPLALPNENDVNDDDENDDESESVTPPLVDMKKGICINGAEDPHEDFILKDGEWNCCKTNEKPYDAVVTTILLRCAVLAPNNFKPSSDGTWEEWTPARQLYKRLWPGESPGQVSVELLTEGDESPVRRDI